MAQPGGFWSVGELDQPRPADPRSHGPFAGSPGPASDAPGSDPDAGSAAAGSAPGPIHPCKHFAQLPLFSVPQLTSDQATWQPMVLAPFAGIGQGTQGQDQRQVSSKKARAQLRSAIQEGRWSWLQKLFAPVAMPQPRPRQYRELTRWSEGAENCNFPMLTPVHYLIMHSCVRGLRRWTPKRQWPPFMKRAWIVYTCIIRSGFVPKPLGMASW